MTPKHPQNVLYVIVSAAPPTLNIAELIVLAQEAGWDVCVIPTPNATKFIDEAVLEKLTGHKIRSEFKLPDEEDILPSADAIISVPATFNTINKWAQGIADNLAATILCDALGSGLISIAVPFLKPELANHPAFSKSLTILQKKGVRVIYDPQKYPSPKLIPWKLILSELSDLMQNPNQTSGNQSFKKNTRKQNFPRQNRLYLSQSPNWDKFKQLITDTLQLEENEIKPNLRFFEDIEMDAMDYVELTMGIEMEFHIKPTDQQFHEARTISQMLGLIDSFTKDRLDA